MDMGIKEKLISLWKEYFNDAELPITFYYTGMPKKLCPVLNTSSLTEFRAACPVNATVSPPSLSGS